MHMHVLFRLVGGMHPPLPPSKSASGCVQTVLENEQKVHSSAFDIQVKNRIDQVRGIK